MSPGSRGEGSVYKRSDGRWAGATYVHNRTGGRQRRQVYGRSKEEVAAKLAELRVMTANGIPAAAVKWTVRTYGDHWLTHVAAPSVKPATLSNYQWVLTRHVYPVVGSVRLTSLAPMHVRQMLLAVLETGSSPRTAQLSKAVLRAMLAEAMRDQLVQRNVAMLVRGRGSSGRRCSRGRPPRQLPSWPRSGTIGSRHCSPSASRSACARASCWPCAGPTSTWRTAACGCPEPCSAWAAGSV